MKLLKQLWDFGKDETPYPRMKGESREAWRERCYEQMERDYPDSAYWMGEEVHEYITGCTVGNTLLRAALTAPPVAALLIWLIWVFS